MKLVAAPRMPRFWKDNKRILDFRDAVVQTAKAVCF